MQHIIRLYKEIIVLFFKHWKFLMKKERNDKAIIFILLFYVVK